MKNELKVVDLKEFCADNSFVETNPLVADSKADYHSPFVTFINDENVSTNIWFSANCADTIEIGANVADVIPGMVIAYTTNKAGEEILKLCPKGNGNRVQLADIL